jgi:hypothetical protein
MEEANPFLGEEFKKVIRNQIRMGRPLITKDTYARLQAEGHDKDEAIRLMACVMAGEMFYMSKERRAFDEIRYADMMKRLPELPDD